MTASAKIVLHKHTGNAFMIPVSNILSLENIVDADKDKDEEGNVLAGQSKKKAAIWYHLGDPSQAFAAVVSERFAFIESKVAGDWIKLAGEGGKRYSLAGYHVEFAEEIGEGKDKKTLVHTGLRAGGNSIRLIVTDPVEDIYSMIDPAADDFDDTDQDDDA